MSYTFLFDTNLYRNLAKSVGGQAIINFNNSLDKSELLKSFVSQKVIYKMTPFSVMEALGITIPNPKIIIPQNITKTGKLWDAINYVSEEAKNYFESLPEIKKEFFLEKAVEQTKYTSSTGKGLESVLISYPLSSNNFEKDLSKRLWFDYVYKYEYPKEFKIEIFHEFLMPSIFENHFLTNTLSKFRIIKRIWSIMYPDLYSKGNYTMELLDEIAKSMKLKKEEDYLDCELVDVAYCGDYYNDIYKATVVFTCDDTKTVINRIKVYKFMIDLFLSFLSEKQSTDYNEVVKSWKQGILVFCNSDGTFRDTLKVDAISPLL